jgi:hypothetical protein
MNATDTQDTQAVALYWDFENLHASLSEAKYGEGTYSKPDARFKVQDPVVNVQAIIELAASYGTVAINRAYCNWQFFGRYRDALLQGAVELIQLFPPGQSAKNGADIKLCLDAAEDIARFPHIGTVLIGWRQRLHAGRSEDQGRGPHPRGRGYQAVNQSALGEELPRLPLLREPGGGGNGSRECGRDEPAR